MGSDNSTAAAGDTSRAEPPAARSPAHPRTAKASTLAAAAAATAKATAKPTLPAGSGRALAATLLLSENESFALAESKVSSAMMLPKSPSSTTASTLEMLGLSRRSSGRSFWEGCACCTSQRRRLASLALLSPPILSCGEAISKESRSLSSASVPKDLLETSFTSVSQSPPRVTVTIPTTTAATNTTARATTTTRRLHGAM
mmetsp:Transcript_74828/g.216282  ORF Transcript_74828/g.216282 Transcript_74828/m.216282 type:complete len:201 (-) Transcript_74828:35-637(-)